MVRLGVSQSSCGPALHSLGREDICSRPRCPHVDQDVAWRVIPNHDVAQMNVCMSDSAPQLLRTRPAPDSHVCWRELPWFALPEPDHAGRRTQSSAMPSDWFLQIMQLRPFSAATAFTKVTKWASTLWLICITAWLGTLVLWRGILCFSLLSRPLKSKTRTPKPKPY